MAVRIAQATGAPLAPRLELPLGSAKEANAPRRLSSARSASIT